ncbi:hypothetical protein LLG95_17195 [bacterium]|nr:hypothetical protein [bacterium]
MINLDFTTIEALAAERGLGLPTLATAMGYKSPSHLYGIRGRGKVIRKRMIAPARPKVGKKIADFLGVSVSDISV